MTITTPVGVVPGEYPNTQELTLAYEAQNGDDPYARQFDRALQESDEKARRFSQ